jgi:hypothetical protein
VLTHPLLSSTTLSTHTVHTISCTALRSFVSSTCKRTSAVLHSVLTQAVLNCHYHLLCVLAASSNWTQEQRFATYAALPLQSLSWTLPPVPALLDKRLRRLTQEAPPPHALLPLVIVDGDTAAAAAAAAASLAAARAATPAPAPAAPAAAASSSAAISSAIQQQQQKLQQQQQKQQKKQKKKAAAASAPAAAAAAAAASSSSGTGDATKSIRRTNPWCEEEDQQLRDAVAQFPEDLSFTNGRNWRGIVKAFPGDRNRSKWLLNCLHFMSLYGSKQY